MTTLEQMTDIDPQERADMDAVMRLWLQGVPIDAETSCRIDERARRITERIRRTHGESIDVDQLLRDARDQS